MEIRCQVSGMSELRYRDLLRFIFDVFILQLDYLVQELACLLAINFGVYYLRDLILEFTVNYNWCRVQLSSLEEKIGCSKFQYRYMENWIDRVHRL